MRRILVIGDDARSPSGVGLQIRNIIEQCGKDFKFVCIGGAQQHPHPGHMVECSGEFQIPYGQCHILGSNDYGNIIQIRQLIKDFKVDAILLTTDPRFHLNTIWRHNMEFDIPILYYWLWDNPPLPKYNIPFIQSCDWVGSISIQSHEMTKLLDPDKQLWQTDYIPHGVDENLFRRRNNDLDVEKMKNEIFAGQQKDFVALWVNRNARRKQPGNLLVGWKKFQKHLGQNTNTALLLHTEAVDEAGSDLLRMVEDMNIPNVYFNSRIDRNKMGLLNSLADIIINVSSAEGFGLNLLEGLMSEKMVIAGVTGGLQDMMGFPKLSPTHLSNHNAQDKTYGEWVIPIFPKSRYLAGSIVTPYITEDIMDWQDIHKAIKIAYELSPRERARRGALGRAHVIEKGMTTKVMGQRFLDSFNKVFTNFVPRKHSWKVYGGSLGPRFVNSTEADLDFNEEYITN